MKIILEIETAGGAEMGIRVYKCPHCKNNLGMAVDAYLYGSPLRTCDKCKKTYIDKRYHEIAIEGIRREDINPNASERRSSRIGGVICILLGIGAIALFILGLHWGYIAIPMPIIGVIIFAAGIYGIIGVNKGGLEKTRQDLERERQESVSRLQDPLYVEKLRIIGYPFSSDNQSAIEKAKEDGNKNEELKL